MKKVGRFCVAIGVLWAVGVHAENNQPVQWVEKPTLDVAPASGLEGSLDGHKVELQGAKLLLMGDSWQIKLGNMESGSDPGVKVGSFKEPLAAGLKVESPMGAASDTWAMFPSKKDPKVMANWNGPRVAMVAELTAYTAKPCVATSQGKPVGTASGRVVAMLKGIQGTQESWVAGTFKDATVVCELAPAPVKPAKKKK